MKKPRRADAHTSPADPPKADSAHHPIDEREHVEQLARAHAALAAAQDRSYWLDRWGLDLNRLMQRPGARRARAAVRMVRELKRGAVTMERYAQRRIDTLRTSAAEDQAAATAPIHETAAQRVKDGKLDASSSDRERPTGPASTPI